MNELSFFDSLFNDVLGNTSAKAGYYSPVCTPRVDVKEEDNSYVLEMELPGRSENDVNIELDHETLTISSVKEQKKEDAKEDDAKKSKFILKERKVAAFERRFLLPSDVDLDSINAGFKNGVLTVNMTKKAVCAPKRIAIEAC